MVRLTRRPAAASAARASSSGFPIMSVGTVASPGPSESVSVTELPSLTLTVASGSWLATRSLGIRASGAR